MATAPLRTYVVTTPSGKRLVKTTTPTQAIAFVTRDGVTCEVATVDDVAELFEQGIRIELAKEPEPAPVAAVAEPAGELDEAAPAAEPEPVSATVEPIRSAKRK